MTTIELIGIVLILAVLLWAFLRREPGVPVTSDSLQSTRAVPSPRALQAAERLSQPSGGG